MMELKVLHSTMTTYGGRWETRLELPVETELLIPDYLPAVFKIVKCLIRPVVLHNDLAGCRWHGEGYLRCTVYYQSDEGGAKLWRTEQKYPFEKTVELPEGRYLPGPAQLWGEVEYCNCRAVSEHRVDLRGAYTLSLAVFSIEERQLPSSMEDCGIEQRVTPQTGVVRAAAAEKIFTAETTLPLPGEGEAILDIDGCFVPQSVTVQAGQISCQGLLRMEAVWRPHGEEELMTRQKEWTVQQSMELEGAAEGDEGVCWGEVLSVALTAPEKEGREPALTIQWKLHAECWRPVKESLVVDAYSTLCETTISTAACKFLRRCAALEKTVTAVAEDDLPEAELSVRGCFVTPGVIQMEAVEDAEAPAVRLTGQGTAHVFCTDARGEMVCYDRDFTWQLPETYPGAPGDYLLQGGAAAARVVSSRTGTRLRVEVDLNLHGILMAVQTLQAVESVELGEEFADKADGPALYLYYAEKGERIFDIAKRYHAKSRDIVAANKLETGPEGEPPQATGETTCLLVPAAL